MKKMITLVLVGVMVAMTCLPVFAAIDANGDIVCDECRQHDQLDYIREDHRSFNRVIECPNHGTHDAEEYYVYGLFYCYECEIYTVEYTGKDYECLK